MILNKQILRELKGNFFRYACIFILVVVGISIVTAYASAANSVKLALREEQENCNAEDGDFQVYDALSDAEQKEIRALGFEIEPQFYYDYEVGDKTTRIFPVRENINLLQPTKGSDEIYEDEVFLDYKYAEANDYKVGDSIKLGKGEYIVKGMGCVPDYILIISDLTSNTSDAENFGLAFLQESQFTLLDNEDIIYNYAFTFDDDYSENKQETLINDLRDYLKDNCAMTGFLEADNSTRVIGIFSKLDSDSSTAMTLGIVIVLIIAFLFFASVKTTIVKECAAIGTLYAQGYTTAEIRRYYIKIPMCITVLGVVLGYILGMKGMASAMIKSSYTYYCFPNVTLVASISQIILVLILPIVLVFIINEIGLMRLLKAEPLQLLKKDIKKEKDLKLNLGLKSFMTRFRIRVLLRSVSDNGILIVGLILSGFLMIMGFGMHDSISENLEKVKKNVPSEYVYMLNQQKEVDEKGVEPIKVKQFTYDFEDAGSKMTLTCYGLVDHSEYIRIDVPGENEVVVSNSVADKFGWSKGDKIKLESTSGDESYELKVSGIYDYPSGLYIFMGKEQLNSLIGDDADDYNAYFSNTELDFSEDELSGVVTKADVIDSSQQYYNMTSGTVSVLIVAAIIISVILMFIIFEMTIDKNKNNISLTKILGYTPKEIRKIYIGGKIIVVIIGLLIAIPLDYLLLRSMWSSLIATFRGFMPFELTTVHLGIVVAVELAAYVAIRLITSVAIEKVDLVHVLKDRE